MLQWIAVQREYRGSMNQMSFDEKGMDLRGDGENMFKIQCMKISEN